jgi:hypothetical protein
LWQIEYNSEKKTPFVRKTQYQTIGEPSQMISLQSVSSIVFIALFCLWWNRRSLRRLAEKIPGPKGLALIGVIHKFFSINVEGKRHLSV